MNVPDGFWTCSAMVNHGMTGMPMDIRFETLMGNLFQAHPDNRLPETRYRLWVTSHNQPSLLFSSIISSNQDPIRTIGKEFPTLLKALVEGSLNGSSQIDLVSETPKIASLVVRSVSGVKETLPWFGCRLEVADDALIREHLTTMVLSLRREKDALIREKDEERRKREELEREIEILQRSNSRPNAKDERFQDIINSFTVESENSHFHSNPGSNSAQSDENNVIPLEFSLPQEGFNDSNMENSEADHRGTPLLNPKTSMSTPSSEQILRGMATYVLCALCPESSRTAVPDEHTVMDHIVNQHFDNQKTCTGCPTRTEIRDIPSHIKMHMSRIYACKFCGKQSNKRNVLRAHVRIHTGERPFECMYCNRRFADSSTLRRHKTIHTGEMKAACPICGRIISRKDNVKAHMRSHHGIENMDEIGNYDISNNQQTDNDQIQNLPNEINLKTEIGSFYS